MTSIPVWNVKNIKLLTALSDKWSPNTHSKHRSSSEPCTHKEKDSLLIFGFETAMYLHFCFEFEQMESVLSINRRSTTS